MNAILTICKSSQNNFYIFSYQVFLDIGCISLDDCILELECFFYFLCSCISCSASKECEIHLIFAINRVYFEDNISIIDVMI